MNKDEQIKRIGADITKAMKMISVAATIAVKNMAESIADMKQHEEWMRVWEDRK